MSRRKASIDLHSNDDDTEIAWVDNAKRQNNSFMINKYTFRILIGITFLSFILLIYITTAFIKLNDHSKYLINELKEAQTLIKSNLLFTEEKISQSSKPSLSIEHNVEINDNSTTISNPEIITNNKDSVDEDKVLKVQNHFTFSYDLRDVLYLPENSDDATVMKEFTSKWDVQDGKYYRCGKTKNILLNEAARQKNVCDIVIISSWSPRPCGIATHSGKLYEALKYNCPEGSRIDVIAMRNANEMNNFPPEVKLTILKEKVTEYFMASTFINNNNYGTVIFAYEFGLYQHEAVLCLLNEVNSRIITILHTLADNLPWRYQALTEQVTLLSNTVVVMTEDMKKEMMLIHSVPSSAITVIPHGVPDVPLKRYQGTPKQIAMAGMKIILCSGLIHQGKGLEFVIQAMPAVIAKHEDALLYIQGTPHPTGEGTAEYYRNLRTLAAKLGLKGHVVFDNKFAPDEELWDLMRSAHVYINAYRDRSASVSGTLVMAMGLGTACISTPYPFARDALKDGAGLLIPFEDPVAIAGAVTYLLDNEYKTWRIGRTAAARVTPWRQVGKMLVDLASSL